MPRGGHPAPGSSRKSSRLRAPPEHKIGVFVRFCPSEPPFSGFSSTKRAFLCQKWQLVPGFGPFRAQNRGFCALFAFETPVFGLFEHKIGIFVSETAIFPWFWPLPSTKLGFLCAFASKFLPDSAPASNKPHSAEKSTPVWLAIWRIWAGFANSQLLPDAAALSSMQGLPWSGNSSAQTSASLHPPAALRLRVLPFTRRGH